MAPRKQAATASSTTAAVPRNAKRVRIGDSSLIDEQVSDERHASGRPKRKSEAEPQYNFKRTKIAPPSEPQDAPAPSKRGRGRPSKALSMPAQTPLVKNGVPANVKESPGRPKKKKTTIGGPATGTERTAIKEAAHRAQGRPASTKKGAGRGRPPKAKATRTAANGDLNLHGNAHAQDLDGITDDEEDDAIPEIQYWLMKAEPDTRMENGHDVSFSIDDLAKAETPEGWDGVRNPAARNHMRAMKKGDLAFFYHSSCKVPGIVGVMEIVEEHSIDETAFDPNHPYFDPKSSRDNPKWELVHVGFRQKFSEKITLEDLRRFAKPGGALENLQMLKQSRLSVSSVQPKEWEFIMSLVGDDGDLSGGGDVLNDEVANSHDSTEAQLNGETNGETTLDSDINEEPVEGEGDNSVDALKDSL